MAVTAKSGLVEDHRVHQVAVQPHSILLVISIAGCVGERLAIKLEVQMHLVIWQRDNHLIHTMSMESASLTEHLVATSGPLLLVFQKEVTGIKVPIVLVATIVIQTIHFPLQWLEIITTVNQPTQQTNLTKIIFTAMTNSGMGSSVKVSAVVMESLHHGSVLSFPTHQLMILRCVFALLKGLLMTLQSSYWRYMFNDNYKTTV